MWECKGGYRLVLWVWLWVVAVGLLHWWLIPVTPWHAGHGLLAGGDWVTFQAQAVELAERIRQEGWSAWSLRYEGQAPASLAAALYALTGVKQPWIVLPVHGVLYGVAVRAALAIVEALGVTGRWRWLAVLPFLFPSSVLIYSQLHKDILSAPGLLLVAYAWVRVLGGIDGVGHIWQPLVAACVGLWLVWWPRPYLAQIALGICVVLWLLACAAAVHERVFARVKQATVLLLVLFASYGAAQRVETLRVEAQRVETPSCDTWKPEVRLPLIDRPMAALFCYRHRFIQAYSGQGANIDHDRLLTNYRKVIEYLPRALQIGLFAPFPTDWFDTGTSPGSRVKRMLAGLEMAVVYVLLIGIVWILKQRRVCWFAIALLVFGVAGALFYAYSSPNVGTIYRMRFPFLVLLVCIGTAGWAHRVRSAVPRGSACAA